MTISINALTQVEYEIPDDLDDSSSIDNFLLRNKGKKVIVIQGLGFVGAVMSLVCANAITEDYAVIGVDLANEDTFWKIKSINEGHFPIVADDPKIAEFFDNTKEKANLLATYDPSVYSHADVIIVDINLDVVKKSNKDDSLEAFDVDLSWFEFAIKSIGKNCKEDVLILVETTVPPGTCEKVVSPIIERQLHIRGLACDKFRLGHSYERVMPGPDYINSIREFPRVYSGNSLESADATENFLRTIIDTSKCELTRLEHTTATEMAKVLENSYRAMNIAFAVEWSRYAEEAKVDLYEVIDAIRVRKTHSNLMYPNIGVGGYCLTKDPLLASWSRTNFFNASSKLDMSINSVSNNDMMPSFAFKRLTEVFGSVRNKKVTFLGVSYRGDVGDTRYTPVEKLVAKVKESGGLLKLHDPFVVFWEEIDKKVESNIYSILQKDTDLVIFSAAHSIYRSSNVIDQLYAMKPMFIFDSVGVLNQEQINFLGEKHTVSVLGRGDL
jgi:UDP-N-acetyl-D-glucosamine dehydrogenase